MYCKARVMLVTLTACLLFTLPALTGAAEKMSVNPKALPTTMEATKPGVQAIRVDKTINPAVKNFWSVRITHVEVGTEADGRWFWMATVENTGNGSVEARRLKLKSTQIKWGPANNPPVPGSVQLVTQTIAGKSSVNIKSYWQRCCLTNELAIELVDMTNGKVYDTKNISNLIHSMPGRIFDTKVSRITWDSATKKWQATLQNNTPYSLKMVVQGVLIKDINTLPTAVGGQRLVLGPNQSKVSMKFSAPNAVNGDKIKVSLYFDQQSPCTDSARDCGAERGNIMTVPTSRDF